MNVSVSYPRILICGRDLIIVNHVSLVIGLVRVLLSSQSTESADVAIQCCGALRNLSYGAFEGNRLRIGSAGACAGMSSYSYDTHMYNNASIL